MNPHRIYGTGVYIYIYIYIINNMYMFIWFLCFLTIFTINMKEMQGKHAIHTWIFLGIIANWKTLPANEL